MKKFESVQMSDIALHFNNTTNEYDVSVVSGDLAAGNSLETAVIISLFTWARAGENDVGVGKPRFGWWGDKIDAENTDSTGSKLYLLKRCKITQETISKAEEYIRDALKWMITDGVASEITTTVERNPDNKDRLDATIVISRGDDNTTLKFNDLWKALR